MTSSLQGPLPFKLSGNEFEKNAYLTRTEHLSEEVAANDIVSKLPWAQAMRVRSSGLDPVSETCNLGHGGRESCCLRAAGISAVNQGGVWFLGELKAILLHGWQPCKLAGWARPTHPLLPPEVR